ncbi:MAG: hypothetical protein M0T80_11375 [Actinomycetota bacterium]|nr:hypothetical protein [Actinomycetota bacterium]
MEHSSGEDVRADCGLLEAAELVLDDLDAALARLDSGHYGRCEVCDDPLGGALLEESPLLRRCGRHFERGEP